ncbi:hypothetical protein CMV_000023 [Castanea mollissima]|uniref:Secreted protein n=1 Tax=Castanea mollissima TaxID=60419 RepID=A0A8J4S1X8_9ROSI|nr:hypothetical protein CMV_000023 [Castanea mollissima]
MKKLFIFLNLLSLSVHHHHHCNVTLTTFLHLQGVVGSCYCGVDRLIQRGHHDSLGPGCRVAIALGHLSAYFE